MSPRRWKTCLLLFFLLQKHPGVQAQIQGNTGASRDTVQAEITILSSAYGEYIQSEQGSVHKLMHDVKLLHKGDTLYCDSAFFYTGQNSVEAFGDVAIYQADGTTAFARYMRYTGGNRKVYMSDNAGDVVLNDPDGGTLWSKEIDYNLNTKTGSYYRGGTLESESTILSSRTGTYNLRTKEARFRGNVEVYDPEYHVISTDLGYNTETKVVRFFGPSVVTNDKSVLQTRNGVYHTETKTSHFVSRASILNEAQYIEADTLDYDQQTGLAIARGTVIAIDTTQKTTLYSRIAQYNEISGDLLAYGDPVMKALDKGDSLFIRADTFFSAYLPAEADRLTPQDSLNLTADFFKSLAAADVARDTVEAQPPASAPDTNGFPQKPAELSDSLLERRDSTSAALKARMDNLVYARTVRQEADSLTTAGAPGQDRPLSPVEKSGGAPEPLSAKAADSASGEDPAGLSVDSVLQTDLPEPEVNAAAQGAYGSDRTDTTRQRYFTGYHNVRIFSDSLQGRCDSMRYSGKDSLLRMYVDPVLWSRGSQITGEVIFMLLDSHKLRELIVPEKAILISRSGPETAGMFDQIQGETIRAFLTNNQIDSLIAEPQASSIYYAKDDSDAYLGCTEAEAERIEITFEAEEIKKIYYRVNVTQTMTPMTQVQPGEKRLSRFTWREDERLKNLEEFLSGEALPAPELLHQPSEIMPLR